MTIVLIALAVIALWGAVAVIRALDVPQAPITSILADRSEPIRADEVAR